MEYLRLNVGVLFIIIFQTLLLFSATCLILGYSSLANEMAIYAYYSLMVGVILQLVPFVRHKEGAMETAV